MRQLISSPSSSSTLSSALLRSYPLPPTLPIPSALRPLRVRPFFLLATFLLISLLAVLALAPIPELPVNDKVLHFLGNGLASLLIYPIFDPPPETDGEQPSWIRNSPLVVTLLASGLVMGVGSEFVQGLTPYRTFDWGDVVANLSSLVFTVPWSVWFWRSRNGFAADTERWGSDERVEGQEEEGLLDGTGFEGFGGGGSRGS